MSRNIWTSALALGAVLVSAGVSRTDDRDTVRTAGGPTGTTMTLGGKGSAAEAATEDNELTHGRRRYGGYYGWGGGYGYRGGYYGGWGGYSRSYYGYHSFYSYRPAYYYAPRLYYPTYYHSYSPIYSGYYDYCAPGVSFYVGFGRISANADDRNTPAVTLGSAAKPAAPMVSPVAPGNGTFRYDGGPANPVPLPAPDAKPMTPPAPQPGANDLPVSLKPKAPASPYKYKAYGEK